MRKRIFEARKTKYGKDKSPKKRQYKEHNHQVAVFDLANIYETQHPELKLMTGSLAGINLDVRVARRAKRAGHKPGFPDIHLPAAHGQWFGLYIELKTTEGKASPEQLRVAQMLREAGYLVLFIKGSEEAWNTIMKYIAMPKLSVVKGEKPDAQKAKPQIRVDRPAVPLQISDRAPAGGPGKGV